MIEKQYNICINYMATIDFVLENFAIDRTLDISGIIETSTIPTLDVSATAYYYVSLESIRNTFLYSESEVSANVIDYYVDFNYNSADVANSNFGGKLTTDGSYGTPNVNGGFYFNPTLAYAETSEIGYPDSNRNKRTVAHDYIRSIAVDLFNTYQGAGLFQNYHELLRDIRNQFGFNGDNTLSAVDGEMANVIFAKLNNIGMQSTNEDLLTDSNNFNYKYANATTLADPNDNITKVLMEQMLGAQPSRFANLGDSNLLSGFTGLRTLPFLANDTISFKLTIHPAEAQNTLISNEITVHPRTYKIQLILVNTESIDNGNDNPAKESTDLPID